jgi:glycosyltransferase involved in cell wall biosynthesis
VKVAVLGPVHPYRGGIAHYTAALAAELRTEGHDVLVINLTRQYPSFLFPGSTQVDNSTVAFDVPAVRIVDSLDPRTWVAAVARMRQHKTERLIVQWWHPYFAPAFGCIARLARRAGIRVTFVCHNVAPHESSLADRALLRWAYSAVDDFVVHAEVEQKKLRQMRPTAAIRVTPHPVYDVFGGLDTANLSRVEARKRLGFEGDRVIAFFGLIRAYKGLDLLLEAFPRIHRTTGARLLIAGECYEDRERYDTLVAAAPTGSVRFDAHYIPNEDVPIYVRAADVLVLPYRHATQSGIVQIAYACGRPVITTAVGGLPEVVEHGVTGLLVAPGNPDALAEAVERFYAADLGATLEAGVEAARGRLGWDRLVATILS